MGQTNSQGLRKPPPGGQQEFPVAPPLRLHFGLTRRPLAVVLTDQGYGATPMRSAEQADEPAFDLRSSQPAAEGPPGRAARTHGSIVRRIFTSLGVLLALVLAYFLFWLMPIASGLA